MRLHLPNIAANIKPTARITRIMRSGGKGLTTKAPVSYESLAPKHRRPLAKRPKL